MISPLAYTIVIPCYRSEASLVELVERIDQVMSGLEATFELILVNDASPDLTWPVIVKLAERFAFVQGVDLQYNTGQYRSILCGLERAKGERIIIMDDDLQHPPEEIPKLIAALDAQPDLDCVMGRYQVKHHSFVRNLGSAMMTRLNTALYGKPRGLVGSSFQIMRADLARAILRHRTVNPILNPLIYRTTRRLANVEVRHEPRARGRSGYTIGQLVRIVVNNILSASTLPLRLMSLVGLVAAAGSAALAIVYLSVYLARNVAVPGFTTLVLLVIFFGGTTLLAVGLVGEYLIRIMDEVRGPPRFVIRDEVRGAEASRTAE